MNCAEVEELLGAYALGAMPEADEQAVREHISTCRRHDTELNDLRSAARRIAATVEPVPAPSRLRSRVLAALDAESDPRRNAQAAEISATTPRPIWTARRWTWWAGSAAAAAIAGLLAWNVVLQRRSDDGLQGLNTRSHVVAPLHAQGGSGTGTVVYFPDEKKALVLGDGLQPLEPTSTYQLWEIAGGQPRSIGRMQADASGKAVIVVPFEQAGHTLAITVEPAGGSPQPTSNPILIAEL